MNAVDTIESPLSGVICDKPFFDAVFMHSPVGIFLTDATGRFMDVNATCATILGYPRSELIGLSFQEITCKEDILYDMQMFNELLAGRDDSYEMTKRFIRKDGEYVWVKIKVNSVRENDKTTHLVKHIIQLNPGLKSSSSLVKDIFKDSHIKKLMKIIIGVLLFAVASSTLTLLHMFGMF